MGRSGLREAGLPVDADGRIALRSQLAAAGLVLVLLAVSIFAIWSSYATGAAASRAIKASALSDDYAAAATAVAGEESLERKYRLEPGPDIEARYDRTAAAFVIALGDLRRDGDAADRALVDGLLTQHRAYLQAIERMYRAVDRGATAMVLKIDGEEVDPSFGAIEKAVLDAAATKHQLSLTQLDRLQSLESTTRRLTPLVFIVGLIIAAALATVTRGHRRLLGIQRAQAVHDSLHDALSGLPNRTLLAERLGQALRADAGTGTRTGLLLIDLDRFKEINDTFGHRYGDQLLAQIGPRLTEVLRAGDTVARLGGDEFAVVLPEVGSVEHAVAVAGQLRAALQVPFRVTDLDPVAGPDLAASAGSGGEEPGAGSGAASTVDLDVEASVGVVISGPHGLDPGVLLQRADIAMYVAKAENLGVFAYTPEVDKHSPARLALLGELRRALDCDELVLHYQAKTSTSTGDIVGAEALVRWLHPRRGVVYPDDFIPLAEHTGLIGPLTRYVLDRALGQIRSWSDSGRPITVSVNLSARNLLDEALPELVAELLALHGVPASLLDLEVTESALISDPVRARTVLERLSALGVRISIDDFGAGYTSLSQLKTLPVSELKIDKSFVLAMADDTSSALIVHSVIDLGHSLGLTIVAEGVETQGVLDTLQGFGCDVAQGYYLSRPIPAAAFDRWRALHHSTSAPPVTRV